MAKIKVLHVGDLLGLGGSEKTLQIFCKYLDKSRFDVFACGRLRGGVREQELKRLGIPVFVGPLDLDELVKQLDVDICHAYRSGHYDPGSLPAKRQGRPRIVETNVFQDYDPVENLLIDCHLFMSRFSRDRYLQKFPRVAGARYETLYNPIDFEEFPPREKDFNFTFGRCGRPDYQKWHEVYVNALPKILKNVPEATCIFKGAPDEIADRIQAHPYNGRVTLLPPSAEVASFYQQLDVFAHAARVGETFGCVIAEAMANGLPVVTLSTPQRKKANAQVELVDDKITGLVCRSPWEYADAVIELLRNNELRMRVGRAGRDKALNEFEAGKLTRKLEELYRELMEQRQGETEVVADSEDLPVRNKSASGRALAFVPQAVTFLLRHPTKLGRLREQWREHQARLHSWQKS